jgi:hypothetical protein
MSRPATIRTEDGVEIGIGESAYDYYSMKPGKIVEFDSYQEREDAYYGRDMQGSLKPWFTFEHTDGTRQYLNGQRICSVEYAKMKGFKNA